MAGTRTIAVTGASRGIGAAIAVELARRGFTVGCLTRKGAGPEAGDVPREAAARFVNCRCDVTDEASVRRALSGLARRSGAIHGLVNNAGIHIDAPSHEMTTETYEKLMAVNATAVFAACRGFPAPRQGGRRHHRQHRVVLRQDRGQAQSRLLRVESCRWRDDALPRG